MNFITQIIIQVIIALGTIYAAHITAKQTVKSELLKINFAKEQKLEEAFGKMSSCVVSCLDSQNHRSAQKAVAELQPYFDGELAATLDELYDALKHFDPYRTDALLQKAIKEYRQVKAGNTNSKTSIFHRSSK